MPAIYYCHACAVEHQFLNPPPADPLATQYQLGKYLKHTLPDPTYPVQSIFNTPSTQAYEHYIVSSLAAGAVELDMRGRMNTIWAAGMPVGFQLNHGQLITPPQDAVKVVRSSDTGKVHAYSAHSTTFAGAECAECGRWAVVT
jgi:hypothetical protein